MTLVGEWVHDFLQLLNMVNAIMLRQNGDNRIWSNLTLDGVLRALEKDLGMERLSLDAHKKFVKKCSEKYFYGTGGEKASETEREVVEEPVHPNHDKIQIEDLRDGNFDLNGYSEGSPALSGHEKADQETEKNHISSGFHSVISEYVLKEAIRKRAPYFRSNLEITMAKVRRLLECDLKLEKNSLDAFKKFISKELDTVLQSEEYVKTTNVAKKEPKKTSSRGTTGKISKGSKRTSNDLDPCHPSDSEYVLSEDEEDEEIRKPKQRHAQRNKADTKISKWQKSSMQRSKASGSEKKKQVEADSERSDESDGGKSSEGDHSQSSGEEEEVKKKTENPAHIYGKQVEHLTSIIKSCGMRITMAKVRRLLEVDVKLEKNSLDALKKFISKELDTYFYGTGGEKASETERKVVEEPAQPNQEKNQIEEDTRHGNSDLNGNSEGSPALSGDEKADQEAKKNHSSSGLHREISEVMVKRAIRKRAPYFRSNLEITMAKVRRLLEGDLKLEKNSLDAFKKFISKELDTVLQSEEYVKTTIGAKKEPKKNSSRGTTGKISKGSKRTSNDLDPFHPSDSEYVLSEDEEDEEIRKPKRPHAQRNKTDTKVSKRQKTSMRRSRASGSEKKKQLGADSERGDESDRGKSSERDHSQSSGEEEEVKKKTEKPPHIYGKQVDHLKSIIKSCGMSVHPSVYKRVKQAPASKRGDVLINELEEILGRECLSTDLLRLMITMAKVRRLLEVDLKLEKNSLDAFKKFISKELDTYFYGTGGEKASETERKVVEGPAQPNQEKNQIEEDIRYGNSDLNGNSEGSPALGEHENADQETEKNHISSGLHREISEYMIKKAIRKRVPYFRSNLEITMAKVRRLLEGDLKLEKNSLDAFKKFINKELDTYFYGTGGEKASETGRKVVEETAKPNQEKNQLEEDIRYGNSDLNGNSEGSPALGEHEKADQETEKIHISSGLHSEISEYMIKKAIRKRVPYFRSNIEITMEKVRRLLERDLKLVKNSLYAFKNFISKELDMVLQSEEYVKTTNGAKEEPKKTSSRGTTGKISKGSKRTSNDLDPCHPSDSEYVLSEDEEDEEIRKPKKRPAQKNKADTKVSKRQRTSMQRSRASGSEKKTQVEAYSECDESDGGNSSEGDHFQSYGEEEEVKKKTKKPAQLYGKQVEHLKSIIKSCGMRVSPSVNKRVKQAPESKRDDVLITELEEILEREGLSTYPSVKEIKAVKKKKERAKELDGIDMSNIVSSSRRRTSNYIPPPKTKIESDSEEEDDGEEKEEESDGGYHYSEDLNKASDGDDAEEESD